MRPHHDDVRVGLAGLFEDLGDGVASLDAGVDGKSRLPGRLEELLDVLGDGGHHVGVGFDGTRTGRHLAT